MTQRRLFPLMVLLMAGMAWGATLPLAKIAINAGYRNFGVIFWQLVIGAVLLGAIQLIRRRPLSLHPKALLFYLLIALVGTIFPNYASFQAAIVLPAGILAIGISAVPMVTYPLALAMGLERFQALRLMGLGAGMVGVLLLILPDASLPSPAMALFVPLAFVAPIFYAFEGNFVAKYGTAGTGPIELLLGASIVGAVICLPIALVMGVWISPLPPYTIADGAVVLSSMLHALTYATYVWLIGRAGSVFAAQVAYVVTGSGVIWSMILLGESYSGFVWAALGAMFIGLFLVTPRAKVAQQ